MVLNGIDYNKTTPCPGNMEAPMNKHTKIILFLTLLIFSLCIFPVPAQQLEFVQSIPHETDLGNKIFRDTLTTWLDMINGARESIDIEVFYISTKDGEPFDQVIQAIKTAGERGVKVRIMVDSEFFKKYPEPATSLGKLPNITMRVINYEPVAGGIMHAKFFIVDRKEVFLGSPNFDWRAMHHIHELGVRIKSPETASEFHRIFQLDWGIAEDVEGEYRGISASMVGRINRRNPVKLNYRGEECTLYPAFSPPGLTYGGLENELEEILRLLKTARNEVMIQVMSYAPQPRDPKQVPWMLLDDVIKDTADRGVKVRLIVSNWSIGKDKIPYLRALDRHDNIQVKISSVPKHSSGHIPFARVEHCKFMIIDNELSWIGTGNWQYGYFFTCRNAGVVIAGKKPAEDLRESFEKSWSAPFVKPVLESRQKEKED